MYFNYTSIKLLKTLAHPNEVIDVKVWTRKRWGCWIKSTPNRMGIQSKPYIEMKGQHGGRRSKNHILILYCSMEMSLKSQTSYRLSQCLRGPACLWLHLLLLSWPHPFTMLNLLCSFISKLNSQAPYPLKSLIPTLSPSSDNPPRPVHGTLR